MSALYKVTYTESSSCYGSRSKTFVAEHADQALEKFNSFLETQNIDITGEPRVEQTFVDHHIVTPTGAFGPRPRSSVENHVQLSKTTVGCCNLFSTGHSCHAHDHDENLGNTVSDTGSEPA